MEQRGISTSLFKIRTKNGIEETISYSFQQLNRIPVTNIEDVKTIESLKDWLKKVEAEIEQLAGYKDMS